MNVTMRRSLKPDLDAEAKAGANKKLKGEKEINHVLADDLGDMPYSTISKFTGGYIQPTDTTSNVYNCVPDRHTYRVLRDPDFPCPPEARVDKRNTNCCSSGHEDGSRDDES